MVPFVNSFVSPAVHAHDLAQDSVAKDAAKKFPNDSAAVLRDVNAWRAAHPLPMATLAQVADQLEHVRDVAGVDHVGSGSVFDGCEDVIPGLENVSRFPYLLAELARRGWSDVDLRKVTGENFIRVFTQAEAVSRRLQKERAPSTITIADTAAAVNP